MISPGLTTVFRDVSESLKNLIKEAIPDLEISFASPGEAGRGKDGRLLVFMYDASENIYLKNQPPTITPSMKPTSYPAAFFDLFYMLVPYATPETELIITNQLAVLFKNKPVLRGDELRGILQRAGNEELRIVPFYPSLDQTNRIWGLFPDGNFRLALYYEISAVRVPLAAKELETRALEADIRFQVEGDTIAEAEPQL